MCLLHFSFTADWIYFHSLLCSHYTRADISRLDLVIFSHLNCRSNHPDKDCLKAVDMFTLLDFIINNDLFLTSSNSL